MDLTWYELFETECALDLRKRNVICRYGDVCLQLLLINYADLTNNTAWDILFIQLRKLQTKPMKILVCEFIVSTMYTTFPAYRSCT